MKLSHPEKISSEINVFCGNNGYRNGKIIYRLHLTRFDMNTPSHMHQNNE